MIFNFVTAKIGFIALVLMLILHCATYLFLGLHSPLINSS